MEHQAEGNWKSGRPREPLPPVPRTFERSCVPRSSVWCFSWRERLDTLLAQQRHGVCITRGSVAHSSDCPGGHLVSSTEHNSLVDSVPPSEVNEQYATDTPHLSGHFRHTDNRKVAVVNSRLYIDGGDFVNWTGQGAGLMPRSYGTVGEFVLDSGEARPLTQRGRSV